MGGKRKRGNAAGIRKKGGTSKQTLAHIAERKESRAAKLRHQVERAEAVVKERAKSAVGFEVQNARMIDENALLEIEHEPESKLSRVRYDGKRMSVYAELVTGLRKSSLEKAGTAKSCEHEHGDEAVNFPGKCGDVSSGDTAFMNASAHAEQSAILESAKAENFAAALREKNHFHPSSLAAPTLQNLSTIAVIPRIGRVSANIPPNKRAGFAKEITSPRYLAPERALGLRPSMYAKWQSEVLSANNPSFEVFRHAFVAALRHYHDVLYCRILSVAEELDYRKLYVAHCVSHVLRARGRVCKNDVAVKNGSEFSDEVKDQGFSRARVLLLVPMKNVAYDIVKTLISLFVDSEGDSRQVPQVANKERFEEEYGPGEPMIQITTGVDDENSSKYGLWKDRRKPPDFGRTFRGNIDDDFKFGVSLSRKSMRLYADFYESDIIIASPLGLRRGVAEKVGVPSSHSHHRTKRENKNEEWNGGIDIVTQSRKEDEADAGYLSSIEICVLDGAHVFSMQNWETLRKSLDMVNKVPTSTRGTDFSRVRDFCLDGLMDRFRQTIVWSRYRTSDLISLMRQFRNHAGRVQILALPHEHGTMKDVVVSLRQAFFRIPDVHQPEHAAAKRLDFFFKHTFPLLRASVNSHALVFVPSYFDYVCVRNKLLKHCEDDEMFQFGSLCEYSKKSDVARTRARFFDGTVPFVMMTERFHFFWRHWIRGATDIVWYGLPENATFYPEVLNMTAEAAESGLSVQAFALYDDLDVFRLSGIVGIARCRKMVSAQSQPMYLFV